MRTIYAFYPKFIQFETFNEDVKNLEIIKRTDRGSPDWPWLEAALEGVKKVLQYAFYQTHTRFNYKRKFSH